MVTSYSVRNTCSTCNASGRICRAVKAVCDPNHACGCTPDHHSLSETGACWAVGWAYSFCHQENQADRRKRQYSLQAQFAKASWIRGAFSYGIRIIALKVSLTGGGEGKAQLSTIQRALGGKAWIIEFGSPARNTEISVLSKASGRRDGTEESSALTTRVGVPFVTSLEATRESLAAGPL